MWSQASPDGSSHPIGSPPRQDQAAGHERHSDRKGRQMCRWLAYSGSPILLKDALYGGTHSLVDQSFIRGWGPRRPTATGLTRLGIRGARPGDRGIGRMQVWRGGRSLLSPGSCWSTSRCRPGAQARWRRRSRSPRPVSSSGPRGWGGSTWLRIRGRCGCWRKRRWRLCCSLTRRGSIFMRSATGMRYRLGCWGSGFR